MPDDETQRELAELDAGAFHDHIRIRGCYECVDDDGEPTGLTALIASQAAEIDRLANIEYAFSHKWTQSQLDYAVRTIEKMGMTPCAGTFARLATHREADTDQGEGT